MMRKITIGSRESALAVAQSWMVMRYFEQEHPEVETELVTMKTTGDRILDRTLDQVGGKGLFVKELDQALRGGRADLTVHSLKDVPMELAEDLPLLAYSRREDPLDALVLPVGMTEPDPDLPIGSSSLRRSLQLQTLYPDLKVEPVRGNLQTRLKKLDQGQYGALVLACAGLRRMGLSDRISRIFTPDEMIPAAGQGIIAVQGYAGGRQEDEGGTTGDGSPGNCRIATLISGFNDPEAELCAVMERAFVTELNGGCSSPVAAYTELTDADPEAGTWRYVLRGLCYNEETGAWCTGRGEGELDTADHEKMLRQARQAGVELARKLRGH